MVEEKVAGSLRGWCSHEYEPYRLRGKRHFPRIAPPWDGLRLSELDALRRFCHCPALDMPDFRELLYRNYSSTFGQAKEHRPELAFRMFDRAGRIPPVARSAPIADLGCGKGEWLAWLQQQGFTDVRGFDFTASELAHAAGLAVECGEVTNTLSSERWRGHFALLHAKDLIEHFTKQETIDFLLACRHALQPGGFLWLSTFNAQGMFSTATRYGDFTHESGFTPGSMAQVLRACGFEVDAVTGVHACPPSFGGRLRRLLWRCAAGPARLVLRARHGGFAAAGIDQFSVDPDLFAIARKIADQAPRRSLSSEAAIDGG